MGVVGIGAIAVYIYKYAVFKGNDDAGIEFECKHIVIYKGFRL